MTLPGTRPVSLPELSFLYMYGPVKATYWSYVDGVFSSNFLAYSSGTGVEIGIARACETSTALGLLSLKMIVWSSGVWMPGMSWIGPGFVGAPSMSAKYAEAYGDGTCELNARSNPYLMSFEVTSRLTGGANLMPGFILTVMVFWSAEISGGPVAMSACGCCESPGAYEYNPRFTA